MTAADHEAAAFDKLLIRIGASMTAADHEAAAFDKLLIRIGGHRPPLQCISDALRLLLLRGC